MWRWFQPAPRAPYHAIAGLAGPYVLAACGDQARARNCRVVEGPPSATPLCPGCAAVTAEHHGGGPSSYWAYTKNGVWHYVVATAVSRRSLCGIDVVERPSEMPMFAMFQCKTCRRALDSR